MSIIKNILLHVLMGATVTLTALMVLVGWSDRLNPVDHPILACAGMLYPFFLIANLVLLVVWIFVKWRRSWVSLAGLLLSYPATRTYIPLHLSSTPPQDCIKVISYNVDLYNLQECDNPQVAIYSYLEQQNADIVCLQEDVSIKPDYLKEIAKIYPYNDTVHVTRPQLLSINAVGIHSRYPILKKERIWYESEANGSAAFFLQVEDDTVLVVNNHFETTHLNMADRERYRNMINGDMKRGEAHAETRMLLGKLSTAMVKRARQANAVHQYIERHRRYPIIVCGDFNDTPISYVRRTVAQGLTDCYVESGNGLGISYNQKGFYFRIDEIMCSDHFVPYNCHVDNKIKASDHFPIICWLKWK